jgi:hypothetical protein
MQTTPDISSERQIQTHVEQAPQIKRLTSSRLHHLGATVNETECRTT